MYELFSIPLGSYMANSYVIRDKSGKTAVIDIGEYSEEYAKFLRSYGIAKVDYILLTHGHFDHICGVKELKDNFGGEIFIHPADALCLEDEEKSLCNCTDDYSQIPVSADTLIEDGDEISLGATNIKVMHTPGHTKGSVIYITDKDIFSGDTLFRLSMGRTDLPGGSTKELFKSLKEIGKIEGEYDIYCGHGDKTTLSYEKRNNRYLRAYDSLHG